MKSRLTVVLAASIFTVSCSGNAPEPPPAASSPESTTPAPAPTPTADEQMAELVAMCADAAAAIEQRQAERSLYERLGQEEGIRAMLVELVSVHSANPRIAPLFDGVDVDSFLQNATDFISVGTGGSAEYKGGDLTEVHRPMNIDNELFLVAGADIEQAMQNRGIGPDERQEITCALVSMRDLVMTESSAGSGS